MPARAVEGEHELSAKPLAERLFADQCVQLRDKRRVAPEGQVGVYAALERLESKLGERRRRGACRFGGQVGERTSSPECERLVEQRGCLAWLHGARFLDEPAETVEVELTRLDAEQIAGRPSDEAISQLAPKAKDVVVQRAEGRGRRIVAPDQVDELRG